MLPSSMKQWAWRALETARGELKLAMDSVLEDLEDLSSSRSTQSTASRNTPSRNMPSPTELDMESTRVEDLCMESTPPIVRIGYEQILPNHFSLPVERCEGFELINFEDEAEIITFSG